MSTSIAARIDEMRVDKIDLLKGIVKGCFLIICLLIGGLIYAFSVRPLWITPDLSSGQMVVSNGPYRSYYYNFTAQLMTGVWTWLDSADRDFPANINGYSIYMGDSLKASLDSELSDLKDREVAKGRTRTVKEMVPNNILDMVKPLGGEKAIVYLDLESVDRLNGQVVSWKRTRYSFLAEVDTGNLNSNKYGLKLVSYYKSPVSLDKR